LIYCGVERISGMIIAIDGPVASGKSTAARNLAGALGFDYFDTGAVYRALTLLAGRSVVDVDDAGAIVRMLGAAEVVLNGQSVSLNGEDVSEQIRLPEISAAVKPFAENPRVRAFVNAYARRNASGRNVVVEGRDMGTVVFPDAEVKIYLSASAEDRARRRWEELDERGTPREYEEVLSQLQERDRADMDRDISPLKAADDAVVVDSTGWSREETLKRLLEIANGRLRRG